MREMSARDALKVGESFAAHLAAIILGLILAAVGLGMGVTVFMIWLGIPIGMIGLGVLSWGVWGFGQARERQRQVDE